MSSDANPTIYLIDDRTDELGELAKRTKQLGARVCEVIYPSDVTKEILTEADLVVVDYTLDVWTEALEVADVANIPVNGVALAAVLREHANNFRDFPPTGFALISGDKQLIGPLPDERRAHVISRLNNVEWFFEKGTDATKNAGKLLSLAKAIRSLPESTNKLGSIDSLLDYLGVGGDDLSGRYRDAVEKCRPPIHHLAARSHGLTVIRWLLHRVLPHMAFLLDTSQVAARICVTAASLEAALNRDETLQEFLGTIQYRGPLFDFDGPRWWRAGLEQKLWTLTEGQSAQSDAILKALNVIGCQHLEALSIRRPVITLDEHLNREEEFSSRDDARAIFLDDWPSYAEPAYARKKTIEEFPHMRMYLADTDED